MESARSTSPSVIRRFADSSLALPILLLLCLAAYLPGLFSIPPIDRDESRFAQASRQMFESAALPQESLVAAMHGGGLAIPHVQEKPRLNKPPLVYWLQVASAAAFTGGRPLKDEIWMYRVPGVLCAIGAVAGLWRLALSMAGRVTAFVAAGALAICPVVVLDAHQARADQLLLLSVVLTQWTLWRIVRGDRRFGTVAILWVFIAMGVLAKGPITPMIAALTAIAWSFMRREWRWLWSLRPWLGIVIVGAAVGPWVYAVASRIGFDTYWTTIWNETIGRSVEGKEGHWGPPGYHLLLVFFLLWPVSLGIPGAFGALWRTLRVPTPLAQSSGSLETAEAAISASAGGPGEIGWRERFRIAAVSRPRDAFLLAWIMPSWIVFEFVSTKLPHYTLPLYPALCILAAAWLVEIAADRAGEERAPTGAFLHWTRFWFGTGFVVLAAIGVLALSMSWWEAFGWWKSTLVDDPAPRTNWLLVVPIALMLTLMVASGRSLARMRTIDSLGLGACALVIGFGLLLGAVAPTALSLSTRVTKAMGHDAGRFPIALLGYNEDSLVFLTRGKAIRSGTTHAPNQIEVQIRSNTDGLTKHPKTTMLRGLNIAKGRCETVLVSKPQPGVLPASEQDGRP